MNVGYVDLEKYKKMLGVYVRERREQLQLTHSELARKAQLRAHQIKNIEEGVSLPKEATLDKLKHHLDLTEKRLEKIEEVAKFAFIDNLLRLMNSNNVEKDEK